MTEAELFAEWKYPDEKPDDSGFGLSHKAERIAFIAGASWQKEQMISALKNDGELPIEFIDKFHEIDRNAFQNGQKNVKEQMLKDAEECDLYWDGDFLAIDLNMRVLGYSERDQVKIVIVKEDKK